MGSVYYLIIEKYEETLFDIIVGIFLIEYRRGARTQSQVVYSCSNGHNGSDGRPKGLEWRCLRPGQDFICW